MQTKMIDLTDKLWAELGEGKSADALEGFKAFLDAGLKRDENGLFPKSDFMSVKGNVGHGKVVELCPFGHNASPARIYAYIDPANPEHLIFHKYQAKKPEQKGQTQFIMDAYDAYSRDLEEYKKTVAQVGQREDMAPVSEQDLQKQAEREERVAAQKKGQMGQQYDGVFKQVSDDIKIAVADPEMRDIAWEELDDFCRQDTELLRKYSQALEVQPEGLSKTDSQLRQIIAEKVRAELNHRADPSQPAMTQDVFNEKMKALQEQTVGRSVETKMENRTGTVQQNESAVFQKAGGETKAELETGTQRAKDRLHRQIEKAALTAEAISEVKTPEKVVTPQKAEVTVEAQQAKNRLHRQMEKVIPAAEAMPDRVPSAGRQMLRTAGGLAMHAGAGIVGTEVGKHLKDYGAVAESNGGELLVQYANELTLAKQKAFANLGAAGMVAAAGGIALNVGGKAIAKTVGKKAATIGAKAVPVVGTVIGLGMAGTRAWNGDFAGAGLEILGAGVDYIPFVGQALSLSIDGALAARDVMMKDGICAFGAVDGQGNPVIIKDENGQDVQAVGAEITYKNDQKNGMAKWYAFDKDGKPYVALIGEHKDDVRTGEWIRMNEKGEAIGVMHFNQGKPVDQILMTDGHGGLLAEGNLTTGQYKEYHSADGLATPVLRQEGWLMEGRPVGVWMQYGSNGAPDTRIDFSKKVYEKYGVQTREDGSSDLCVRESGEVINNGTALYKWRDGPAPKPKQLTPEELRVQQFEMDMADVVTRGSKHPITSVYIPTKPQDYTYLGTPGQNIADEVIHNAQKAPLSVGEMAKKTGGSQR